MTKDEFAKTFQISRINVGTPYEFVLVFGGKEGKTRWQHEKSMRGRGTDEEVLQEAWKRYVQQALSEGKPVPPEVLRDYPDLAKPAEKGVTSEVEITAYRGVQKYPIYEGQPEVWQGFPVHPKRGVLFFTTNKAQAEQYGIASEVELTFKNPLYTDKWDVVDQFQIRDKNELIKQGYDGVIYYNPADRENPSQIIVFYEKQIELVAKPVLQYVRS